MDAKTLISLLGGPTEVAKLCECTPQAVSRWYGVDPKTGLQHGIPKARLLHLKAARPAAFHDPILSPTLAAEPVKTKKRTR